MNIQHGIINRFDLTDQENIQKEIKKTYNILHFKLCQRNMPLRFSDNNLTTEYSTKSPMESPRSLNKNNIPKSDRTNNEESKKNTIKGNDENEMDIMMNGICKTIKIDKKILLKLNNQIRDNNSKIVNMKLKAAKEKKIKMAKQNKNEDFMKSRNIFETNTNNKNKYQLSKFPSSSTNNYKNSKHGQNYHDYFQNIKVHKPVDIPINKSQQIYLSDYIYHVEKNFLRPSRESRSFNYLNMNTMGNKESINEEISLEEDGVDGDYYFKANIKKIPFNLYIEKGNQLKKSFLKKNKF
jgi:hypothetical protein